MKMKMRIQEKRVLLILVCLLFISVPAYGYIAYDVPAPSTGNEPYGGYAGTLGMDFDVNSSITITAMGAYDSDQDGILGTVQVVIYDRNTYLQVPGTLTSFTGTQEPLIDGSRFQNLSPPVILGVGQYSVVAWGYHPEVNGNWAHPDFDGLSTENNGGGLISFVGTSRWGGAGSYPTGTSYGLPTNCFYAGTFEYGLVPLPPTLLLLGSGLGLLAWSRRRRQS